MADLVFPYTNMKPPHSRLPTINALPPPIYFRHLIPSYPNNRIEYRAPTLINPLSDLSSNPPTVLLSADYKYANELSSEEFKSCLDLVEQTSAADYRNSSMGWSRARKGREMRLLDLRYLLLRQGKPSLEDGKEQEQDQDAQQEGEGEIQGFASFMLTLEDGIEVVYLYEIHLSPPLQGLGVGKQLIRIVEEVGRRAGVEKVMLTVFRRNKGAVGFYERLGFGIDEFSPPRTRRLRGGRGKEEGGYVILSKTIGEVEGKRKRGAEERVGPEGLMKKRKMR